MLTTDPGVQFAVAFLRHPVYGHTPLANSGGDLEARFRSRWLVALPALFALPMAGGSRRQKPGSSIVAAGGE